jgi:hypothetical protein
VVRKETSAAKPLGLVWVVTSSYSITSVGLKMALEDKADVPIGEEPSDGSPSCIVLYAGGMEEGSSTAWDAFVNSLRACRSWSSVRTWILRWPGPR